MDSTTIMIIIAVLALLGIYLYNRSRPAPRGTYDDRQLNSGGSIGGGPRAHDDPKLHSSGSIGGKDRGYDSTNHESGGTIGASAERARREHRMTAEGSPVDEFVDDKTMTSPEENNRRPSQSQRQDDERLRSSGSLGDSSSR